MKEINESLVAFFKNFGTQILEAIAVLLGGLLVIRIVGRIINKIFRRTQVEGTAISFIASFVKAALALLIFYTILGIFKASATSIVSISAAVGIAVGFALQDSLSNVASGIILLFTKPFKENDNVKIDDVEGKISKVNITTTEIITESNVQIIIPNKKLLSSNIHNFSSHAFRCVNYVIPVFNSIPQNDVMDSIQSVIKKNQAILQTPEPEVFISSITSASISYTIRFWVDKDNYKAMVNMFLGLVLNEFLSRGIKF
jgi:small conductance mechanosensitive channel